MNIEDFKLEVKALQVKDTEDAKNSGFNDKDAWLKHKLEDNHDEIVEAVIDMAKRYNVQDNVVAYAIDPSLLIRLINYRNNLAKSNKEITR